MKYIHLGNDISIPENEIIGIFDLEVISVNKSVNEFLKVEQKKGRIYYCSLDMPKSFIVADNKTYVSNVSTLTLKKRILNYKISPFSRFSLL